jgi:DNA-binding beta-propeller fold protein YncE
MNCLVAKRIARFAIASIALTMAPSAYAQHIRRITTFATGTAVNATGPDSITLSRNSVWVSYTNGADSTGLSGSSTIVQYNLHGEVRHRYSIAGSVDGVKVDPRAGRVWALQNQDGNSTLSVINPKTHTVSASIPYAVKSATQGYDDVVFRGDQVFLSYTNPVAPSDPTIQLLQNGSNPLVVTPILTMGATGTNLATGQTNQPTTDTDSDSLKLTPTGDLMLSSGADGQLIFVEKPGRPDQSVSFLQLLDPSTGLAVSGLDDAVFATAREGAFYLADTSNNRILKIEVDHVRVGTLFASVGSLNQLTVVDIHTGVTSPFVSNLKGPHGLEFVPRSDDDEDEQ